MSTSLREYLGGTPLTQNPAFKAPRDVMGEAEKDPFAPVSSLPLFGRQIRGL